MTRYYWFDAFGAYLGYVAPDGTFCDKDGRPWGRVDASGKVHDPHGCYVGHIDGQGNFFGEHAHWLGYLRDWPRRVAAVAYSTACADAAPIPSSSILR